MNLNIPKLSITGGPDRWNFVATAEFTSGTTRSFEAASELAAIHGLTCALAKSTTYQPCDEDLAPLWKAVRQFDFTYAGFGFDFVECRELVLCALKARTLPESVDQAVRRAFQAFPGMVGATMNLGAEIGKSRCPDHPLHSFAWAKQFAGSGVIKHAAEALGIPFVDGKDPKTGYPSLRLDRSIGAQNCDTIDTWVNRRASAWASDWRNGAARMARCHIRHKREHAKAKAWFADPANLENLKAAPA